MLIACIPTIGESPHLKPLVSQILADDGVDEIHLTVNQPGIRLPIQPHYRVHVVETWMYGRSIYHGWNHGIRYGKSTGARVAILNDDIVFEHPQAVSLAAAIMADHPQIVVLGFNYNGGEGPGPEVRFCKGTYRDGGIGGFAFMVDAMRCPLVDEQFEHWGGDDDLVRQVDLAGHKLGIAKALTVGHTAETTASKHEWTFEARARDRERFIAKYGKEAAW